MTNWCLTLEALLIALGSGPMSLTSCLSRLIYWETPVSNNICILYSSFERKKRWCSKSTQEKEVISIKEEEQGIIMERESALQISVNAVSWRTFYGSCVFLAFLTSWVRHLSRILVQSILRSAILSLHCLKPKHLSFFRLYTMPKMRHYKWLWYGSLSVDPNVAIIWRAVLEFLLTFKCFCCSALVTCLVGCIIPGMALTF